MASGRVTAFRIPWTKDGADALQVEVDQLPADAALFEQRLRSIASMVGSHAGLRLMLEVRFEEDYDVTVGETVGRVTTVRLTRRTSVR